jgi:hypothetical protein
MVLFSKQKTPQNVVDAMDFASSMYLWWHWKGESTNLDTIDLNSPLGRSLERQQWVKLLSCNWWWYNAGVWMRMLLQQLVCEQRQVEVLFLVPLNPSVF